MSAAEALAIFGVFLAGITLGIGLGFGLSAPNEARCEGYAAGSGLTCKVMEKSCWCEDESGAWREAE